MALSWGLCCGFDAFLPYFYVCFFAGFLSTRVNRDNTRWVTNSHTNACPSPFCGSAASLHDLTRTRSFRHYFLDAARSMARTGTSTVPLCHTSSFQGYGDA